MTGWQKVTIICGLLALLVGIVNLVWAAHSAGWAAGFDRCVELRRGMP